MTVLLERPDHAAPVDSDGRPSQPLRQSPQRPPRSARLGRVLTALAVALIGLGCLEMAAWHLHLTALLRPRSGDTPMMFNTALSLALTGFALLGATRRNAFVVRAAGGVVTALGVVNLVETASGWRLGIDELFVHAYAVPVGSAPGRMAVNTAASLTATGLTLLCWRAGGRRWRATASTAAAVFVASLALVAGFGYMAGIPTAYRWRSLTGMALPTALGLTLTAASLFALGWSQRREDRGRGGERLAIPAGVAVFAIAGLVWQAFIQLGNERSTVSVSSASRVVLFVAGLTGALLALATWLGQRANARRVEAEALADRLRTEIRRREHAEESARDTEHLLAQFLEALPVGVFIAEDGARPVYVNHEAERLLGRGIVGDTDGKELGEIYDIYVRSTDAIYPQDDMPVARALRGECSHVEDMDIRAAGRNTPLEAWGTPVYDDDGRVRFGVVAFADVTQRRAAESAIAELAMLLDLAQDAIYVRDSDRRITFWNRGAELAYGYSRDDAIGQISLNLLHSELPEPIEAIEGQLVRDGHWEGELVHYDRAGNRRVMASRWVPELDGDGSLRALMAINTEVTARREAEHQLAERAAELQRVNLELTRSNDDLEQFAYAASHDLSEPLRAISGPISLLARRYDADLDDDAKRFMAFAVDGCQRMQVLINDLLAFSRVGRLEGPIEVVRTETVLASTLVALQTTVAATGAEVTWDELPDVPGEPTQLGQLFQNLVSNAIKFKQAGHPPCVHVTCDRDDAFWRFTVTDNGIGIEPQHRDRIFGMFKRLHTRDAYPGTGIGLALCKKIVERHGGQIGVDDGPDGVGSTFWFTLPATKESTP